MPTGSESLFENAPERVLRFLPDTIRPLIAGEAFGQLVRFAVAGLAVTLFCVGVYLGMASAFGVDPLLANVVSHGAGVVTGYAIHSRWSFRAEPGGDAAKFARFVIASGGSFALNTAWVWLAVHALHGPAWLPVPAMIFVTPIASFAINRYWVFGK